MRSILVMLTLLGGIAAYGETLELKQVELKRHLHIERMVGE
jgi:hypothetical protein